MIAGKLDEKLSPLPNSSKSSSLTFEKVIRDFAREACPKVPVYIQDEFARNMGQALKAWATAPELERESVLKRHRIRMEKKFLGPRQIRVDLKFSKRLNPNRDSVENATASFFDQLIEVVSEYRKKNDFPNGQLSFRIDGIDMNHPKLAVSTSTFSDLMFRKSELRHGKGRINRKKAGRPASVQLDFSGFQTSDSDRKAS
jgi:hypothetical protein